MVLLCNISGYLIKCVDLVILVIPLRTNINVIALH